MGDWQIGLFECAASLSGNREDMRPRKLAGWVKEPFALDPRRYWEDAEEGEADLGWVITHLPTGYIVRGIKGPLSEAKHIADELLAAGDWNFVDANPDILRHLGKKVKSVSERYPVCVPATDFDKPLWLDWEG